VRCEKTVLPDPLASYRGPVDTVELASGSGIDGFVQQCRAGGFEEQAGAAGAGAGGESLESDGDDALE
jgi:hypothetical protein